MLTQSLVPLTVRGQEKMKVLVVLGTTSGLGCKRDTCVVDGGAVSGGHDGIQ